MKNVKHHIHRRDFIRQAGCAALGSTTLLSTLLNMKHIGASAINNSSIQGGGYKALVCLVLGGGNDSFNMLIPTESSEYNTYAATRSNLAIPANQIRGLNAIGTGSRSFGLHPAMVNSQSLFDQGKMAFISNIGTLIEPITKTQFYSGTKPTPLGLYSHSDQIMHWQTGIPSERGSVGWGGKIADMINSANTNQSLSMNMSLAGTNLWQTGNQLVEFALNPYNPNAPVETLYGDNNDSIINTSRRNYLDNMLDANYYNAFQNTYKNVLKSGREGAQQLETALQTTPVYNQPFTGANNESGTRLLNSFKIISDVISARDAIGMSRQTFFVSYDEFDNHDELINTHNENMSNVDLALYKFNAAMEQLGLSDCVTTFVLSEFGRTLTSNGNGSDHGWGGNVMVMGGAVNGQRIYGDYPLLDLNGNIEIGGGVYIPSTSADEYFAELAMWFGVPTSELTTLFPNLTNFYSSGSGSPIGFLEM